MMEMEKAAKEAEAASGGGGVWVWLPDQTLLGGPDVACCFY